MTRQCSGLTFFTIDKHQMLLGRFKSSKKRLTDSMIPAIRCETTWKTLYSVHVVKTIREALKR